MKKVVRWQGWAGAVLVGLASLNGVAMGAEGAADVAPKPDPLPELLPPPTGLPISKVLIIDSRGNMVKADWRFESKWVWRANPNKGDGGPASIPFLRTWVEFPADTKISDFE